MLSGTVKCFLPIASIGQTQAKAQLGTGAPSSPLLEPKKFRREVATVEADLVPVEVKPVQAAAGACAILVSRVYVDKKPETQAGVAEAVEPFKAYESKLREIYAQQPDHPAALANHLVPVFKDAPISVRARDLTQESDAEKDKYLLALPREARRTDGSPATTQTLKDFRTNFNLFSESSLVDLDWSNVVCAGSAVVTSLLPVGAPHNESKRALRAYYHEKLAPASDVDLFLYGLNEKQAIEKIRQIETKIRDSILAETTTIRTKNAITIVSEYPTRHVQIVLRLYKSISEILTGFDVDCSCVAYDGRQVWASPRALAAFMTQVNTIDLTRRSPSYENRLSKYSHRGFEVVFPTIDRSRIDPTIFERSFSRVQGLARLLVLEKLPHPNDRDTYLAKRRAERGRPALPWNARIRHELPGNVKDAQPDDVAEWVEEDEVSNYHTVTIPYGPKYNAKRVEKLLFTKDLLLNAEWNKPKDRETQLHRHPAFFGSVNDVLHDCCGYCPEPTTDADFAALEEEGKIYISGDVTFLKDDPGRQAIGSFNPITDNDWTEMAYVGNTTRLCQAIVDLDLDAVRDWFSASEVVDVNRRDPAGRTPLHLAVMCSTPEIVQCLIEHGARLVSRLYNGMTALHLAAHRGEVQMVKDILDKSNANEEQEALKEDARKEARRNAAKESQEVDNDKHDLGESDSADSEDFEDEDEDEDEDEEDAMTEGSFVKVDRVSETQDPEDKEGPDVYDVDVLAWDSPLSPLHLAILGGHMDVVKVLVDNYDADVLLPVKIVDEYNRKHAKAAILTICLALELPLQQANETVKGLLALRASCTQADMNHISALHYAVNSAKTLIVQTMHSAEPSNFANAINFIAISGFWTQPTVDTPLLTAIRTGKPELVEDLVRMGAKPHIDFETFAQAYKRSFDRASDDPQEVKKVFQKYVEQPVILALKHELVDFVIQLIEKGEEVNALTTSAYQYLEAPYRSWGPSPKSLLDLVRDRISSLEEYLSPEPRKLEQPAALKKDDEYLSSFEEGSYCHWTAFHDLQDAKSIHQRQMRQYKEEVETKDRSTELDKKGAKAFSDLYPKETSEEQTQQRPNYYFGANSFSNDPYETKISFKVPDLTSEKKAKYIELFEAVWKGDLDTVKSICLTGANPLQVAVMDLRGFSPFSIATIRGHYELAQLIVEIAKIQYQPSDESKTYRYVLGTDEEYDGDSECSDNSDGTEHSARVRVVAELVDETFTVNDVAAVANNVKSRVSPTVMTSWTCQIAHALENVMNKRQVRHVFGGIHAQNVYINDQSNQSWAWFNAVFERTSQVNRWSLIRFAIFVNNIDLLKFIIKVGNTLAGEKDEDDLHVITISKADFDLAVRLGRVEIIGEMIKSTGFGFPLQKVFQKSGIQLDEKPKYYQGLSVYGKKRQDWAEAGRRGYNVKQVESDVGVPLLAATIEGNLKTTEYFMSDTPLRHYLEFAETFKEDKRIQALAKAKGGIRGTLDAWLSTRNNLALHIGVLSPPKKDGIQPCFDFLLEKMTNALEVRSSDGKTPLHLAFEIGRYYAAKKLIAVGAKQVTKDNLGRNILHTVLGTIPTDNPALLDSVLKILDQNIVAALLHERCSSVVSTGNTPLALFLGRITDGGWEESLKLILALSGGKDLEKMDGAGDYPLHSVVRRGHQELVKFIVEYRPGLLYWENATGMTVCDVVTTAYLQYQIDNPPKLDNTSERSIKDVLAHKFLEDSESDSGKDEIPDAAGRSRQWQMYRLIDSLMVKYPAKRKLVALHDANEVAKRLALQQQKQNEANRRRERLGMNARNWRYREHSQDAGDAGEADNGRDEVAQYLNQAKNFTKWDEMVWRKVEAKEMTGWGGQDIEMEYRRRGSDASVFDETQA
ncbi:Ankyrin repeat-containing protein [Cladophialophora immunda]|nr:Ankyrin repeat-containing protein [Cladophialophora immunda]